MEVPVLLKLSIKYPGSGARWCMNGRGLSGPLQAYGSISTTAKWSLSLRGDKFCASIKGPFDCPLDGAHEAHGAPVGLRFEHE